MRIAAMAAGAVGGYFAARLAAAGHYVFFIARGAHRDAIAKNGSGVVTFTNIGLRADFVARWLKAFITGWPVAAVLAFFAVPYVRRATEAIVQLIDGPA